MFRDSSPFITMADQGYSEGFLLLLLGLPVIVGVGWMLYMFFVKKRPVSQQHKLLSIASAINMGWATWLLGFNYIVVIISSICFFYITKAFLKIQRNIYVSIHKDYYAKNQNDK